MTTPGYYRVIEGEPPVSGRPVSPVELASLPPGTRILLHSHLHGDKFQLLIRKARADGNMLPIIRGRRNGRIITSILAEKHSGHGEQPPSVAMEYVITLEEAGPPRHLGRSPEYRKPRRGLSPSWLAAKPIRRNGRR